MARIEDLVSSDSEIALVSALWHFQQNVLNKITLDKDTTVKTVTEKVNGGTNGLTDRQEIFDRIKGYDFKDLVKSFFK